MALKQTVKLIQKVCKAWLPPPKLKYSEWAGQNFVLSTEDSSEPGRYDINRAPFQIEMMDALNDPETYEVIYMTSAQIGKTTIEKIVIGYHIDQDPGPIMLVLPSKDPLAKDWSRDRLAPMIRDCKVLSNKVSDPKSRDGDNSTFHKKFPGGLIVITGANNPNDLRSRPIRIILYDEVDGFSNTQEGDPIGLAEKRQMTFKNRKKSIKVSTPTIEGASRIHDEYLQGTQEKWYLKCPDCGELVFLEIYGMKYEFKWISDEVVEVWNVKYLCPHCGCLNGESKYKLQQGKWVADNPEIKGKRSFHINAFYSPFYSWESIIKELLEAKDDPQKLMVVYNTLFGVPWKEKASIDDENKLFNRREEYKAELPDGVLLLTTGVDTQDDRLEYEIVGWGKENESWGIEYGIIMGKADDKSTWQMLDDKLNKIYRFENQRGLKIACTFIDSGGHFTTDVYKYCKRNESRRIYAIKGRGGPGIPLIDKLSRNNKENALLILLGVDDGKTSIMSALSIKEPGPRYCHFPSNENKGYEKNYFHCLLSEHEILKISRGKKHFTWVKNEVGGRNEALDTRNYALAAKEILKPDYNALEKRIKDMQINDGIPQKRQYQRPRGVVRKGEEY